MRSDLGRGKLQIIEEPRRLESRNQSRNDLVGEESVLSIRPPGTANDGIKTPLEKEFASANQEP